MNVFDLNDVVQSIITKHLLRDFSISTMLMSEHQSLQNMFLGEIVFDDDFRKI